MGEQIVTFIYFRQEELLNKCYIWYLRYFLVKT